MTSEDAEVGAPEGDRGQDELALPHGEGDRALHAGEPREKRHGHRHDDVEQARAQPRHDGQGQEQSRKRQHHVDHAHGDEVETAAEISGHHAHPRATDRGHAHHDQGNHEGHPRAPHHAAPDVAAEVVGTEEVRAARRLEAVGEIVGDRIVGGEHGGEQRDGDHGREDRPAHYGGHAAAKPCLHPSDHAGGDGARRGTLHGSADGDARCHARTRGSKAA